MAETCKNWVFDKAPERIVLKGNKEHPESAEHIIIFPGGSVGVCRTTNNEYWAHIEIYNGHPGTGGTRESITGSMVDVRVDTTDGSDRQMSEQLNKKELIHLAVRIKQALQKEKKDVC